MNILTEKELLEIFKKTEALLSGHFLLTSGRHSNVYFQCAKVLQYPEYNKNICAVIANHYAGFKIDTVIAPAIGGIVVGQEVARQLKKRFIFAEREDKKLSLRRGFSIKKGERLLVCEDVVTTGGSVFEVINIINQSEAVPVGVGFIVDRSKGKVQFGVHQKSVISLEAISYEPENCHLCNENIPFIKPGSRKVV
ncbi:MAG: orotate phosphoribosyltransferase [Ignavibacteria bacterium CG08_land_8_20_14_0_20_37_9]|nr:orotate phosphoribosyltransferase [Ignavibacteria bacterium]OIO20563.1 MAG: orotate phosphoribosyltransferase [Ignavibacteria bacterium CG1_02_37_35]PIS43696.1 MAG: orotate phosphoribosyltransferase [Ignavibacteria bacterium CG08_land_8_20_14_0_20_37_9]PJC57263.1 MAG: orotate phosphoribosyltransferase [Ignavibacteria bacterium CG_4_9_14_0_2_um_filter_37_13]